MLFSIDVSPANSFITTTRAVNMMQNNNKEYTYPTNLGISNRIDEEKFKLGDDQQDKLL